jgi:predicted ATPase
MRAGDVVANRYRIRRHAGSGGMGTVYEALDMTADVVVALKTWRAAPDTEPRARTRLFREARALAEIRHPAVVRYVDHGTTAEHGPYLVMAWVGGETLADALQSRGLRPDEALRLTTRLAAGLTAMHAAGIVHRDLKPSNVMLADADVDRAVIVDFGVARVADGSEGSAEERGHLGTARYMAPEQIRNARTVDGRADVFALGCILFEALTGRPAFEGVDPVTVLARILFEPLPVPSAVRPALPESLDRLVLTLLARELDRRPHADALDAMVRAVEQALGAPGVRAFAAAPMVEGRAGKNLEITSAAESTREVPVPPSRQFARRDVSGVRPALPAMSGLFVGRDEEVSHLAALLGAGARVVTVWGGPGTGKTRLIAEAVRRVPDGAAAPWEAVVIGDLADARDADDVARILARAAGVALDASSPPEIALGHALAKLGRVLVVVDPIDHLLTPLSAALVAWQHAAPGLQVVAASRVRWRPPGAVAIEVGPLATRGSATAPSPAAALFVARAWPGAGGAEIGEARLARVEQLVHALDGIPLAIELYAARAEVLGIDALLARLPGQPESDATLDSSEGAMTRAIAWSWQRLTPAEQRAFAQCAVFRGGFTLEAAKDVVDAGEGAALEWIRSLREKSLLCAAASDAASDERLTMFASVRDFAWRMLKSGPVIGDVLRRHAAHYASAFASEASAGIAAATPRIEREAENLFAAAEYSLSEEGADVASGLLALIALEPAMTARGAMGSYRGLLDRAVRASENQAEARTRRLGARVRQIRGRIEAPRGHLARAEDDFAFCLALAEREDDERWRGEIELDRGVAFHLGRDLAAARRCYENALALLVGKGDPRAEARSIGNLGALCHDEGDFAAAARWYRQAIALFEQVGDARQRANCAGNLAVLEQELGHPDEARELYERAIARLEEVGDARLLGITLGNLGVLELELGRSARALPLFERSLALLAGSGDHRSEALCLARLGAALALVGRTNESEAKLVAAERLAFAQDRWVVEAIRLFGEFAALARGEDVATVQRRIEHVSRDDGSGRSLAEQSDDIRSTLRILAKELERRASA